MALRMTLALVSATRPHAHTHLLLVLTHPLNGSKNDSGSAPPTSPSGLDHRHGEGEPPCTRGVLLQAHGEIAPRPPRAWSRRQISEISEQIDWRVGVQTGSTLDGSAAHGGRGSIDGSAAHGGYMVHGGMGSMAADSAVNSPRHSGEQLSLSVTL